MTDQHDFEPRDRSFGPAVQAAVERARNASTDPNWRPDLWPKEPPQELDTKAWEKLYLTGNRVIDFSARTITHDAASSGTITPPTAEALSPFQRAELERILLDMDVVRERLRKLLDGA